MLLLTMRYCIDTQFISPQILSFDHFDPLQAPYTIIWELSFLIKSCYNNSPTIIQLSYVQINLDEGLMSTLITVIISSPIITP